MEEKGGGGEGGRGREGRALLCVSFSLSLSPRDTLERPNSLSLKAILWDRRKGRKRAREHWPPHRYQRFFKSRVLLFAAFQRLSEISHSVLHIATMYEGKSNLQGRMMKDLS